MFDLKKKHDKKLALRGRRGLYDNTCDLFKQVIFFGKRKLIFTSMIIMMTTVVRHLAVHVKRRVDTCVLVIIYYWSGSAYSQLSFFENN